MRKIDPRGFEPEAGGKYVEFTSTAPLNTDDVGGGSWDAYTGLIPKGLRVYDATTMEVFTALVEIPDDGSPLRTTRPSDAIKSIDNELASAWFYLGPCNSHRMFDGRIYTQTQATAPAGSTEALSATVAIESGRCDQVGLFSLSGVASATVTVQDSGGVTVDVLNVALSYPAPHDGDKMPHWVGSHVAVDTPSYTVVLQAMETGGTVGIGAFIPSEAVELGDTEARAEFLFDDYSRTEFNKDYGVAAFVKRGISRRARATLKPDNGAWAMDQIIAQRGAPAIWDFNNTYEGPSFDPGRIIYGVAKPTTWSSTGLEHHDRIDIEVKGLVEVGSELNTDFATAFYNSLQSVNIRVTNLASDVSLLQTKISSGTSNLLTDSYLIEHFLDTVPDPDIRKWSHWTRLSADGEYGVAGLDDYAAGKPNTAIHDLDARDGSTTVYIRSPSGSIAYFVLAQTRVPVIQTRFYQASVYLKSLRGEGFCQIVYRNAAGSVLEAHHSAFLDSVGQSYTSGDRSLEGFDRVWVLAKAPAGTVSAEMRLILKSTYSDVSTVLFTRPFFGEAIEGQEHPSSWIPATSGASVSVLASAIESEGIQRALLKTDLETQLGGKLALAGQTTESFIVEDENGNSATGASHSWTTTALGEKAEAEAFLTLKSLVEEGADGIKSLAQLTADLEATIQDLPGANLLPDTKLGLWETTWGRSLVDAFGSNGDVFGTNYWLDAADGSLTGFIRNNNTSAVSMLAGTPKIPCSPGAWFQASAYFKTSGISATAKTCLLFVDEDGSPARYLCSAGVAGPGAVDDHSLDSFKRAGVFGRAPTAAESLTGKAATHVILRVVGETDGSGSIATVFFVWPMLSSATALQSTLSPFVHGSEGSESYAKAHSTLSAEVTLLDGRVTANAQEIVDLQAATEAPLYANLLPGTKLEDWENEWTHTAYSSKGSYPPTWIFGTNYYLASSDGTETVYLRNPNTAQQFMTTNSPKVPCEPLKRYQGSAYVRLFHCDSYLVLYWYDSDGGLLGQTNGGPAPLNAGTAGPNHGLDAFYRVFIFGSAPEGAVQMKLRVVGRTNGNGNVATIFMTCPMLANARDGASAAGELAPFEHGSESKGILARLQRQGVVYASPDGGGGSYSVKLSVDDNGTYTETGFGMKIAKVGSVGYIDQFYIRSSNFAIIDDGSDPQFTPSSNNYPFQVLNGVTYIKEGNIPSLSANKITTGTLDAINVNIINLSVTNADIINLNGVKLDDNSVPRGSKLQFFSSSKTRFGQSYFPGSVQTVVSDSFSIPRAGDYLVTCQAAISIDNATYSSSFGTIQVFSMLQVNYNSTSTALTEMETTGIVQPMPANRGLFSQSMIVNANYPQTIDVLVRGWYVRSSGADGAVFIQSAIFTVIEV